MDDYQLVINNNTNGFYLAFIGYDECEFSTDKSICKILKMDLKIYQKTLKKYYKAFANVIDIKTKEMYFETEQDAKKAFEWIETIIIANKLNGD